jgi:hypothetical protein
VSSVRETEMLEADARYYHERVALLRAKLYRWGLGPNARLRELERSAELAERRLREYRSRAAH